MKSETQLSIMGQTQDCLKTLRCESARTGIKAFWCIRVGFAMLVRLLSLRLCLRARSFGIFRKRIYSRIYTGIYSGYSAPGSRIAGMEIQVFQNENSTQTNAYLHYSNYSYSGLIPNERALSLLPALLAKTRHKRLPPLVWDGAANENPHVFWFCIELFAKW